MAALANAGTSSRARWIVTALLHGLHRVFWADTTTTTTTTTVAADESVRPTRHYPPRRDRAIERAAMAREMYRL